MVDHTNQSHLRSLTAVMNAPTSLLMKSLRSKGVICRLSSIIDKDILATDDSLSSDSLLFCTPEALVRSKWRYAIDDPTVSDRVVALVVDEAHCISKW